MTDIFNDTPELDDIDIRHCGACGQLYVGEHRCDLAWRQSPCLVCDDPSHSTDECPNGDGIEP